MSISMGDWMKVQKRFEALEGRVEFLEREAARAKAEELAADRPRRGRPPKVERGDDEQAA